MDKNSCLFQILPRQLQHLYLSFTVEEKPFQIIAPELYFLSDPVYQLREPNPKRTRVFLLGKNLTVRPGYINTFCYWIPDMYPVSLCWFKPILNFHPYPKQFERGIFLTEKIMLGIRCGDVACFFCDQIQLRNFWHHSDYYYVFFTESE